MNTPASFQNELAQATNATELGITATLQVAIKQLAGRLGGAEMDYLKVAVAYSLAAGQLLGTPGTMPDDTQVAMADALDLVFEPLS